MIPINTDTIESVNQAPVTFADGKAVDAKRFREIERKLNQAALMAYPDPIPTQLGSSQPQQLQVNKPLPEVVPPSEIILPGLSLNGNIELKRDTPVMDNSPQMELPLYDPIEASKIYDLLTVVYEKVKKIEIALSLINIADEDKIINIMNYAKEKAKI